MNKLLTIVIPSYNTEKYIDKTIPTILSSNYIEQLDIIFVNDGSTDGTPDIAAKYVAQYPDSVRLLNKENGGHGSTINVGIREARGKYFKVIDGDDYVDTKELDRFLDIIRTIDVDVVTADFTCVSATDGEEEVQSVDYIYLDKSQRIKRNQTFCVDDVILKLQLCFHSNYYRTELLQKHTEIHLSEHTFYEDSEYYLFPLAFAHTIFVSDCNVYRYVTNQVTQSCSMENMRKRIGEHGNVVLGLARFYEKYFQNASLDMRRFVVRNIALRHVVVQYGIAMTFSDNLQIHMKELKKFDEELKGISKEIYDFSNRDAVTLLIRRSNYTLYFLFCYLKRNAFLRAICRTINSVHKGIKK